MTTQELTMQITQLTETECLDVSRYVTQVIENRSEKPAMKRFTRESFIATLKKSHAQSKRGELHTWPSLLGEIKRDYGLSI